MTTWQQAVKDCIASAVRSECLRLFISTDVDWFSATVLVTMYARVHLDVARVERGAHLERLRRDQR